MKRSVRSRLKALLPAAWRRAVRGPDWQWLRGDYAAWAEARASATQADGAAHLQRVWRAAREVVEGRAAWDRDGVAFPEPEVHAPLLASLRRIAECRDGRLDLVDFGGGLGSGWRQHKAALADLRQVRWRVVELPDVVAVGTRDFSGEVLSFHESLDAAARVGLPDAILLSSVLPYLEHPQEPLIWAAGKGLGDVIVDRTPFVLDGGERITVQHTPPLLGGGSHPCRLFSRASFLGAWSQNYELVAEWTVPFDRIDPTVEHRGFHFRRRGGGDRRAEP